MTQTNDMPDHSDIARIFGEVIRELRLKSGLSQEEFGFECELHRTYISLLERGKRVPSLATVVQLAIVLKIAPSEIIRRFEVRLGWSSEKIKD